MDSRARWKTSSTVGWSRYGEQDGEDDLTLRRHFLPAPGQGFLKIFPVVFAEILNHSKQGMSLNETKVQ